MTAMTLAELRQLAAPRKRELLSFSAVSGGFPRGALVELSGAHGAGKTRLTLNFLAEHAEKNVAWVEDGLTVYPRAFPQAGVGLARVLFVEAGEQAVWAAQQLLRSGLFGVVVLSLEQQLEQLELRRLQLAAEKVDAVVIILSETATTTGSWPIAVQLDVNRNSVRRLK